MIIDVSELMVTDVGLYNIRNNIASFHGVLALCVFAYVGNLPKANQQLTSHEGAAAEAEAF